MKTRHILPLLAAGALACLAISPAAALPSPACTTSDKSADAPSGAYVDQNGRKWTGYNADGTAPASLVENTGETTCEVVPA